MEDTTATHILNYQSLILWSSECSITTNIVYKNMLLKESNNEGRFCIYVNLMCSPYHS